MGKILIRHEVTIHPNFEINTFKEFHNNELVQFEIFNQEGILIEAKSFKNGNLTKHLIETPKGHPIYLYEIREDKIFWYEYTISNLIKEQCVTK
jgi:hypothetical protein